MGSLGGLEIMMLSFVFLPPLVAFWDIVQSDFEKQIDKVIWLAIVILFLPFGALAYYLFGAQRKVTE